jgi:DNA polymerase III alpha subunit
MFIDFHCHTKISYDGFTTYKELLKACKNKNISAIAITEHDKLDLKAKSYFKKYGLDIITGCEFTTDLGAHVIGLFINEAIPKKNDIKSILNYILSQNGLVLIPHPFKDKTGILKIYKNINFLNKCHLIELVNGGIKETKKEKNQIISIAKKYGLKTVSGSDSHKVNQVGYYVNYYKSKQVNLYKIIKEQKPIIYYDSSYKSPPRKIYEFQKTYFYKILLKIISPKIRRYIKLFLYFAINSKPKIQKPTYKELDT